MRFQFSLSQALGAMFAAAAVMLLTLRMADHFGAAVAFFTVFLLGPFALLMAAIFVFAVLQLVFYVVLAVLNVWSIASRLMMTLLKPRASRTV